MSEYLQFFYKHIELSIAFFVIVLLILWEEFGSKRYTRSGIAPQQLVDLINHSNAAVLDIRAQENFKQGHIIDAINIPPSMLGTHLKKLVKYKNSPLVIVADKRQEANQVIKHLKESGFQKLSILSGGLEAWKQANLPMIQSSKQSH